MKLGRKQKIEAVRYTGDEDRGTITQPWLSRNKDGKCHIVATNGAVMVTLEVPDDGSTPGPIPLEALKFMRSVGVVLTESAALAMTPPIPALHRKRWSDFKAGHEPTWRPCMEIGDVGCQFRVNVALLSAACQALGTTEVQIEVSKDGFKIRVTPLKSETICSAVICTMRSNK